MTGDGNPFDYAAHSNGGHDIPGKPKYGSYNSAGGTGDEGTNLSFHHSTDFQTPASRFQWDISGHFYSPFDGLQFGLDQDLAWLGNVSRITVSGDFSNPPGDEDLTPPGKDCVLVQGMQAPVPRKGYRRSSGRGSLHA